MNKAKNFILYSVFCVLFTVLSGCNKNPINQLIEPDTNNNTVQVSGQWILYGDEIMTDGGVMFISWGQNYSVDFSCRENPRAGVKCTKIYWSGGSVNISGGTTSLYTGFSLITAKEYTTYLTTTRDISAGGYTKLTFWARKGFMSANTVLRVQSPNGTENSTAPVNVWEGTLSENWTQYSLNIAGSLAAIKDYVIVVLKTNDLRPGNGATVYIDDIRLE